MTWPQRGGSVLHTPPTRRPAYHRGMRVANWPRIPVAMSTVGLFTVVLVAGCGKKGEDGDGDDQAEGGTETETGGEETDTGGEMGTWEFEDVIGAINSDDDDQGDKADW